MKKLTLLLTLFAFMVLATTTNAQVRVTKGDIKVLKGQKTIGVEFTYDNMTVGKLSEKDYLAKKSDEYNKKEPGKGDTWKLAWVADRKSRFEPKFFDLLAKGTEKAGVQFSPDVAGTKYKFIVNTDFTEPGFNIVIAKANAEIRTTIKIVETDNPTKIIATMSAAGPGRTFSGNDWDTGVRLAEAYAKTAKDLGAYLSKKAFK